ncbi:MAG: glycosyltransferase family 2 protein [Bacilli bacterium]
MKTSKNHYKVSVIIPIYNEELRMDKCIKSVLNQTLKGIEIILINDGSTDQSLEKCYEYSNNYPNILVINKKNGGQGSARNLGIKRASAEFISFIDADDYIKENMLEKLYQKLTDKVDIVICDIIKKYKNKEIYFNNYKNFTNDTSKNLIISHPGPVARLYRKKLFIDNDIFFLENHIYEDLATIPLLGIYTRKIIYINCPYYFYNIHNGSSMNQISYSNKLDDIFYVIDYLEKQFIKRSSNVYKTELEYLFIEHILYSASLRFIRYKGIYQEKISDILKELKVKYPHWQKNDYYKKKSYKFKLVCQLVIMKQYYFLKLLLKTKKM